MNRLIYRSRTGNEVREYISGDFYLNFSQFKKLADYAEEYDCGWIFHCRDVTMKAWGNRISIEEARQIIPDYDAKYEVAKVAFENTQTTCEQNSSLSSIIVEALRVKHMTRILIAKEKHGDRYFDASDEQLYKAAFFLLKERFDHGYWYAEPDMPEPLDFTQEDLERMPASVRRESEKELERYNRRVALYKAEKADYEEIVTAIKTNDGKLAWRILQRHSGYEYEEVNLETCEVIT